MFSTTRTRAMTTSRLAPLLAMLAVVSSTATAHGASFGLDDLLRDISGAANAESPSVCPEGKYPAPTENPDYVIECNGCGPKGMQIEEPFGLYRCCNQHDACFATCGTAAPFCERIFKQCMSKVCAEDHVGQTREDCERQATSMSTMTGAFGGGFHLTSQRGDASSGRLGACDCHDDADAAERRWLDVFARFYREHGHPPMSDAAAREKARDVVRKNTGAKRGAAYFRALRKYNATTLSSERLFAWDNVRAEL